VVANGVFGFVGVHSMLVPLPGLFIIYFSGVLDGVDLAGVVLAGVDPP